MFRMDEIINEIANRFFDGDEIKAEQVIEIVQPVIEELQRQNYDLIESVKQLRNEIEECQEQIEYCCGGDQYI